MKTIKRQWLNDVIFINFEKQSATVFCSIVLTDDKMKSHHNIFYVSKGRLLNFEDTFNDASVN